MGGVKKNLTITPYVHSLIIFLKISSTLCHQVFSTMICNKYSRLFFLLTDSIYLKNWTQCCVLFSCFAACLISSIYKLFWTCTRKATLAQNILMLIFRILIWYCACFWFVCLLLCDMLILGVIFADVLLALKSHRSLQYILVNKISYLDLIQWRDSYLTLLQHVNLVWQMIIIKKKCMNQDLCMLATCFTQLIIESRSCISFDFICGLISLRHVFCPRQVSNHFDRLG